MAQILSNSKAAPELFSPPITLGLVRRLVLSQTSQLCGVWPQTPNNFYLFMLPDVMEIQGRMVLICNHIPSKHVKNVEN